MNSTPSTPERMSATTTRPGLLVARQVDLGDVAGDDHLRAEAEAGEEHLHLLGARVLGLVEDHERVVERAAAHERERRDLDHRALEVRGDALGVEHVVQRVEQRAQVGVDLRHQVAGQEAEALAGLDRGAREDDAVDLAARQRGDGHRDRQERLAGAGRADAEGDRRAADRVDVALLVDRLRRDLEVAVAPHDVLEDLGGRLALVEHARHRLDRGRPELVPARHQRGQLAHHGGRGLHRVGVAVERDDVPAQEDRAVQVLLERAQDLVLRAGQLGRDFVGELKLPSRH